jgi:O-acetylhomoserine (thiol)-lyase
MTHPETLALHAGWRSDSATNAVAVPIYQTTSYQFDSAEHASNRQYLHAHHESDH